MALCNWLLLSMQTDLFWILSREPQRPNARFQACLRSSSGRMSTVPEDRKSVGEARHSIQDSLSLYVAWWFSASSRMHSDSVFFVSLFEYDGRRNNDRHFFPPTAQIGRMDVWTV